MSAHAQDGTHLSFREGFTLIELMLVVAIIGVVSSIALPKFANIVIKSKEAAVKGQLGAFRSALSIYYSNNEGVFPLSAANLSHALTEGGTYLNEVPNVEIPPPANRANTNLITGMMADNGRWFYSGAPAGHVALCCQTHTSLEGRIWSRW
jgi:prepilin-type N-terminal cleavage/methylation domain-containing protein